MLKQKEWVEVIVAKTGCTKKDAKIVYDYVFDSIKEKVMIDDSIKIQGFGVFKLRKTANKEQINLLTGKPEIVAEHNVVTFKPYFELEAKPEAIEIENEDVVEEVPPVVEEVKPVEPEPVKEEYMWIFNSRIYNTEQMVQILVEKTDLEESDVSESLNVVLSSMKKSGKKICEVKEEDDTFDFIILK